MDGFWISLSNSAGVLDRRFASTAEEAAQVAMQMLRETAELHDGDTLRIDAGWSEE